jgi:hypothetical protein
MSLREEIDELMQEPLRDDALVLDLQFFEQEEAFEALKNDPTIVIRALVTLMRMERGTTRAIHRLADEVEALKASL